jgi:phosphohistidine phosphatase SixA
MVRKFRLLILSLALCGFCPSVPLIAAEGEPIWGLLQRGGQVVLIRHASTGPGVGDPPGFRLDDCRTQRNLSEVGREEARRLGDAFKARGIPVGQVLSSRWCRCLETARLAFGTAEPWPPLDSFFDDRSRAGVQTQAVRELITERPPVGNLILVSHQVNITALTGLAPAPGEIVVLTPLGGGEFRVAGRIPLATVTP